MVLYADGRGGQPRAGAVGDLRDRGVPSPAQRSAWNLKGDIFTFRGCRFVEDFFTSLFTFLPLFAADLELERVCNDLVNLPIKSIYG